MVKVEAYNGITSCSSELSETGIKTFDDVTKYNNDNTGTEGADPNDHPAYPSGQDNFREIVQAHGEENETYRNALEYTKRKCRSEGIDAALKDGDNVFDTFLLFDCKGAGQQIAAQAGKQLQSYVHLEICFLLSVLAIFSILLDCIPLTSQLFSLASTNKDARWL